MQPFSIISTTCFQERCNLLLGGMQPVSRTGEPCWDHHLEVDWGLGAPWFTDPDPRGQVRSWFTDCLHLCCFVFGLSHLSVNESSAISTMKDLQFFLSLTLVVYVDSLLSSLGVIFHLYWCLRLAQCVFNFPFQCHFYNSDMSFNVVKTFDLPAAVSSLLISSFSKNVYIYFHEI